MIVLKIILFILLAVLGIILLTLFLPVGIEFSFINDKVVYRIKYAFVNLLDSDGGGVLSSLSENKAEDNPEKSAEEKSHMTPAEEQLESPVNSGSAPEHIASDENAARKAAINQEERSVKNGSKAENKKTKNKLSKTPGETVGFLMDIWRSARRPFRKLFKGFHISDIYIDFLVADEDAYKCAIKYGRVCSVLYKMIAHFENLFTVNYKTVDVECGFGKDKCRWDSGCRVWFLPITAVISGIWFLITYIFRIYIPDKRKNKKSADKQNAQPQGGM